MKDWPSFPLQFEPSAPTLLAGQARGRQAWHDLALGPSGAAAGSAPGPPRCELLASGIPGLMGTCALCMNSVCVSVYKIFLSLKKHSPRWR